MSLSLSISNTPKKTNVTKMRTLQVASAAANNNKASLLSTATTVPPLDVTATGQRQQHHHHQRGPAARGQCEHRGGGERHSSQQQQRRRSQQPMIQTRTALAAGGQQQQQQQQGNTSNIIDPLLGDVTAATHLHPSPPSSSSSCSSSASSCTGSLDESWSSIPSLSNNGRKRRRRRRRLVDFDTIFYCCNDDEESRPRQRQVHGHQQQHKHQRRNSKRRRSSSSLVFWWLRLLLIPICICCCVMFYTFYSFHQHYYNYSHSSSDYYNHYDEQPQQQQQERKIAVVGGLNLEKIQQIGNKKRHHAFGEQIISSTSSIQNAGGDGGESVGEGSDQQQQGFLSLLNKKRPSFRPQRDFNSQNNIQQRSKELLQPPKPRQRQQNRPHRRRRRQQHDQLGPVDAFLAWIGSWTGISRLVLGQSESSYKQSQQRLVEHEQEELFLEQQPQERDTQQQEASDDDERNTRFFDYMQIAIPTAQTLPRPRLYNLTTSGSNNSSSNNSIPLGGITGGGGIVIIVLSARSHFAMRQAIRETWGQGQAVYFVIGGGNNNSRGGGGGDSASSNNNILEKSDTTNAATRMTICGNEQLAELTLKGVNTTLSSSSTISDYDKTRQQQLLEQEFQEHGDLLDTIHPESYLSLPYKLQFAYHWIYTHYQYDAHWEWILKVDDDMLVHTITKLQNDVLRPLNGYSQPIVLGNIVPNAKISKIGKWAEHIYPGRLRYSPNVNQVVRVPYYPYWPKGSCGHVVSRAVAEYVAQQFHPYSENSSISNRGDDTNKSTTSTKETSSVTATNNNNAPNAIKGRRRTTNTSAVSSLTTNLVYYQGEDTSLGIWLDESPLSVVWIKSRYFTNDKHCPWQNENHHHKRNNKNNNKNHEIPLSMLRRGGGGDGGDFTGATKTAIVIGHAWTVQELRYCHAQLEREEQQLEQQRRGKDRTTAIAAEGAAVFGNKDRYLWFVETHEQRREMEINYFRSLHGKTSPKNNNNNNNNKNKAINNAAPDDYYDTPLVMEDPAFS